MIDSTSSTTLIWYMAALAGIISKNGLRIEACVIETTLTRLT